MAEAELRTGATAGKRRDSLTATIDIMITEDFAGRVLPFDSAAAKAHAAIAASRRAAGQPSMEADCQIAAIARVRGVAVATNNVRNFEGCDIVIVDPFHVP
ncbi:type II toxin-antitoxin system VapC family toxin [Methylocystis sp. S23]